MVKGVIASNMTEIVSTGSIPVRRIFVSFNKLLQIYPTKKGHIIILSTDYST